MKQEFIDAGMGYNNPVKELMHEAQTMHPRVGSIPARKIDCVISIGTGKRAIIKIEQKSSGWINKFKSSNRFAQIMKDIVHDCEGVHQDMARSCKLLKNSEYGVYFRLNVEHGLQEISEMETKNLGNVIAHTNAYVILFLVFFSSLKLYHSYQADADTDVTINKAIAALTGRYTQEYLNMTEEYQEASPIIQTRPSLITEAFRPPPLVETQRVAETVIIDKNPHEEEYVAPILQYR